MQNQANITRGLFLLRVSVFLVMFMWTLDKFVNPEHTARVFAKFYFIPNLSNMASYIVGGLQLAVILAFLAGIKKKCSYGIVLLLHGISTLSSFEKYFNPWEKVNLLFFAAWPMLAACAVLYICRDQDTLFTYNKKVV